MKIAFQVLHIALRYAWNTTLLANNLQATIRAVVKGFYKSFDY